VREVGNCQTWLGKAVQLGEAVELEARETVLLEEHLLGLA